MAFPISAATGTIKTLAMVWEIKVAMTKDMREKTARIGQISRP